VLGDPFLALRSISTRFILPRLENLETRRSKHLSLQMQKGGKKPRKQSRCISNNRNLKHIVVQSPVTHGPGRKHVPAQSSHILTCRVHPSNAAPAPLATSPTNHKGQQNQALATSLPESSKERPRRTPLVVRRHRARNKLSLARSRLTSNIVVQSCIDQTVGKQAFT
jgi:hypothetical protein